MAITELFPALSVTCEALYIPFPDGSDLNNEPELHQLVCDVIFKPNTKEDGVILVAGTAKGIIANTFTFSNVGDPAGAYPWPFDEQIVNLADTDLNPSGANYTVTIKPRGYVSVSNTVVHLEGLADRVGILICEAGTSTTPLLQWMPLESASDGTAYLVGPPGPQGETGATGPAATDITPGPNVVAWGDSLTAGDYPAWLATVLGRTVTNRGVGGETSRGIAARQGGAPYRLTPVGGTIPASGGVAVTLEPANTWPLLQNGATLGGTLAGVAGTLSITKATPGSIAHEAGDVYTFTRATAGAAVTVARPTAFITDHATTHRSDLQVIWAGSNNALDPAQVVADVKAMTRWCETAEQRYLVLSPLGGRTATSGSSTHTALGTITTQLATEFGERFLDIRRWLITWGLADAGIAATQADLEAVAADTVPPSLRADDIHLTATGRLIVARQVAKRLAELGWATIAVPWTEPAALAAQPNLVTNGSFEVNTAGWGGNAGAAISRITTDWYAGGACLQVVHAAATTSQARWSSSGFVTGIVAGQPISARCFVKAPVGHASYLMVFLVTAAEAMVGNIQATVTGTGGWVPLLATGTAGAGAEKFRFEFGKTGASAASTDTVFIDSVQVWQ